MSKPRRHLPRQVSFLTRRTASRAFYLRPDAHCRRVVRFELAKAALRADCTIHGLMTMSNHPHIVLTDNRGDRSDFMRDFAAGTARSRNHRIGRKGHFWDNQQFGDTVLLDRDAIERKLIYTWTNPVQAGLVRRAKQWPGAKVLPHQWGQPMELTPPDDGFYEVDRPPLTFTPQPPPGFEEMSLEEVTAHFEEKLREAEDRIAARLRRRGRGFRGARWVLRQSWLKCPHTPAERSKLSPRFASTDAARRNGAIRAYASFLAAYDVCRRGWLDGDRDIEFPAGTIWLRKHAAVRCRPPDPLGR